MVTFDNIKLVEHDGQNYYINVIRYTKTTPFHEMKRFLPKGGVFGISHILIIRYEGLPAKRRWKLYKGDELLAEGMTDKDGKSYDLPIDLPYFGRSEYRLELGEI